jgi:hypothetical protein
LGLFKPKNNLGLFKPKNNLGLFKPNFFFEIFFVFKSPKFDFENSSRQYFLAAYSWVLWDNSGEIGLI